MTKRIEPRYECIAYLSVEADLNVVDRLEDKQLKYIKEYANLIKKNNKLIKKVGVYEVYEAKWKFKSNY